MKDKLAVFDIDGTIFRSSLIIELVNILIAKGIFPKRAEVEIEKDYLAWVNRKGSYENYITKVVEIYKKYISGTLEKDEKNAVKELISKQKDRTYTYTRNLIKKLQRENYFLYAISGSPQVLVEEFTKVLGFDDFLGNRYEVLNGKHTGRLPVDIFKDKANILRSFLENHKNFKIEDSIGVGDSEGDIPFLEIVGNPIAFNPAKGLAIHAKNKNWQIVIERKNVVYDVKNPEFLEVQS